MLIYRGVSEWIVVYLYFVVVKEWDLLEILEKKLWYIVKLKKIKITIYLVWFIFIKMFIIYVNICIFYMSIDGYWRIYIILLIRVKEGEGNIWGEKEVI